MEKITSRKHEYIKHIRNLSSDSLYRNETGEMVCEGITFLNEALMYSGVITSVLWKKEGQEVDGLNCESYYAPEDVFDYASPLKNCPGPIFTVKIPKVSATKLEKIIALESVQDPGNVGTVVRTANAFNIDAVLLTGDCADLYNIRTIRATMGSIFRQCVIRCDDLKEFADKNGLKLYGATLSDKSVDVRNVDKTNAIFVVGNEGKGMSAELIEKCDGQVIIPMNPNSESLNAAVASAVLMWEMFKN